MPPSSPSPLLPPSSSGSIADAPLPVLPDEEKEEEEGADDVASLIPNLFSRLQQCDDTVTELEFQDIHRLLTLETSEDQMLRTATSFANQPLSMSKPNESKNVEAQGLEVQKKSLSSYAQGKENAVPTKISERYRSTRRERSSRVTSHRRPFVVDLRSFGVANNDMLDDYKKLKDVHAFWEAADEREASEALMRKLRGESEPCTQQSVCEVPRSRRPGVRRKNSQRTTTRLKGFNVELPLCTEQVRLLDEERLEEEEEVTEGSCFTFVQNPRTDLGLEVSESQNGDTHIQNPQQDSLNIASDLTMEAVYLAGKNAKPQNLVDDDMPVEPCSFESSAPLTQASNHQCTNDQANKEHNTELSQGCDSVQAITQQLREAVRSPVAGIQGCSGVEVNLEDPLKVTPYIRNVLRKRTPATSPTPPSNPLAAHGLRKDNIFQQDMGKRRLEFNDTMPSPSLSPTMEPTHIDGTKKDSPCLQNVPASDISEATLMTSTQKDLPCPHNVSPALEIPAYQEQDTELQEADDLVDSNAHAPSIKETNELVAQHTSKKFTAKRKRALTDRRDSLEGAGSKWDRGLRRSTRIKSRPLEWWRGERFLRGRVHKSLATVIGIKYSSPPPCWPKRGARLPQFKVESFVSDDYAKYVRFAALY